MYEVRIGCVILVQLYGKVLWTKVSRYHFRFERRRFHRVAVFYSVQHSVLDSLWMVWISDMIDGPLARRLGAESRTGAVIDSVADLFFVIAALVKILPVLEIAPWLWVWITVIAVIRLGNLVCGYLRRNCFVSLHTAANKLTGLLLFLLPVGAEFIDQTYCMIACCSVATFSSVQESFKIRRI